MFLLYMTIMMILLRKGFLAIPTYYLTYTTILTSLHVHFDCLLFQPTEASTADAFPHSFFLDHPTCNFFFPCSFLLFCHSIRFLLCSQSGGLGFSLLLSHPVRFLLCSQSGGLCSYRLLGSNPCSLPKILQRPLF